MQDKKSNVKCSYFQIDPENSFVQFQLKVSEEEYRTLTEAQGGTPVGKNSGKTLILCLDCSGSMSGKPMDAVKIGALKIGEELLVGTDKYFDNFITLTYDSKVATFDRVDHEQFKNYINGVNAHGSTDFVKVFKWIENYYYEGLEELAIIFFTDGEDTCNDKATVWEELRKLQLFLSEKSADTKSRFLSIGFSQNNDAALMNEITKTGSDLGNFFYIDNNQANYSDEIVRCLSESLSIAIDGSNELKLNISDALKLQHSLQFKVGYEFSEEKSSDDLPVIKRVILSGKTILKTSLLKDINVQVACKDKLYPFPLEKIFVQEPNEVMRLQSQLHNKNKILFELVQAFQRIDKRKQTYESLQQLERQVDIYAQTAIRVKERDSRREIMDEVIDFKQKLQQVLKLICNSLDSQLSNTIIAQLNDCAYKVIWQNDKIKLDERTFKIKSIFQANDQQLNSLTKNLDSTQVRTKYKDIIKMIGFCPMSQCDIVELMESGDCMGICLSICRSEDTINDPTKLVVKNIFPIFMSLDQFLESGIFNLKKNPNFEIGFYQKNQAESAIRVEGESVTGLMPLYLFKEHKDILRVKMAPIFGFMCTFDPMISTAIQSSTIPFLVLLKAIEDFAKEPSEMKQNILKLVMETCVDLIGSDDAFKMQIFEQANLFTSELTKRTPDVTPSIQLLAAQVVGLSILTLEQQDKPNMDPQTAAEDCEFNFNITDFIRAAAKEILSRNLNKDVKNLTKDQILSLLIPNCTVAVQQFKLTYQEQIKQDKQEIGEDPSALYNSFTTFAQDSNSFQLSQGGTMNFTSLQQGFINSVKALLKTEKQISVEKILGQEPELFFAVLLQNVLHTKNSNIVDAIKDVSYKELRTKFKCTVCKKVIEKFQKNIDYLSSCSHATHNQCFQNDIVYQKKTNYITICKKKNCGKEISETDINQMLTQEQLKEIDDFQLERIKKEAGIVSCDCGAQFQLVSGEIDLNIKNDQGQIISKEAAIHYSQYRVKCPTCQISFCGQINCKLRPYHIGYTCEQIIKNQNSIKCKFCEVYLEDPSQAICNKPECKVFMNFSCNKNLQCGHRCYGVKTATNCFPCFDQQCNKNMNMKNKIRIDDWCNICYSGILEREPCIKLTSCDHVFHYNCLKKVLENRWTTPRIILKFLNCTQCQVRMEAKDNPEIQAMIDDATNIEKMVQSKSILRAKAEGLDKVDYKSQGHKDLQAYAQHMCSYYLCFECKVPYFGGMKACEGNEQQERVYKPEELVCPKCQANLVGACAGVTNCDKHGTDFIDFKCKFCCSVAMWFCFGTTHFCDPCHNIHSTVQASQCKGKGSCSLGPDMENHPPNGNEFALGCHVCRSQKVNFKDY